MGTRTRAERRALRRRIIERRVAAAQAQSQSSMRSDERNPLSGRYHAEVWPDSTPHGRFDGWNPGVCCAFCQFEDHGPRRWSWDHHVDDLEELDGYRPARYERRRH